MTLVLFERAGNVSHSRKHWFNAVITILNLALGLNFLEVFKDMAKILRWRVLASRPSTARETDLILGGESLMKLWHLMLESRKKPITRLACVLWILLNLLAQATIAMLSLNYSMDLGTSSAGTYTVAGTISAPRLDCYYGNNKCDATLVAPQTTAHSYGQLILGESCCEYNVTADIFSANQSCSYFCSANRQEFTYRFREHNPTDTLHTYPYLTNRIITSSVEACYQYDVDWNKSHLIDSPDGKQDTQLFAFHNSSYSAQIPIPNSAGAFNSTTYVYNGTNIPQLATLVSCGSRCLRIYVLRLGIPPSSPPNALLPASIFSCEITVSNVTNTTAQWQEYPDGMARLAIASIALTGRFFDPAGLGISWQQYQLYPWGNFLETHNLAADQIGSNIAEFTIGSIASTAALNQKEHYFSQDLPILGYSLSTRWPYVIVLFVCVGAVHFVLVGLLCWVARPVVVCDDSDLCTARLLQELVGRIPDCGGSLLDGKELAGAIENTILDKNGDEGEVSGTDLREPTGVVYGVVRVKNSAGTIRQTLRLSEGIQPLGSWRDTFPKGEYT